MERFRIPPLLVNLFPPHCARLPVPGHACHPFMQHTTHGLCNHSLCGCQPCTACLAFPMPSLPMEHGLGFPITYPSPLYYTAMPSLYRRTVPAYHNTCQLNHPTISYAPDRTTIPLQNCPSPHLPVEPTMQLGWLDFQLHVPFVTVHGSTTQTSATTFPHLEEQLPARVQFFLPRRNSYYALAFTAVSAILNLILCFWFILPCSYLVPDYMDRATFPMPAFATFLPLPQLPCA